MFYNSCSLGKNNKQDKQSQFYYQLIQKSIALKKVFKFTLKQLQHVSV
jgi:hypothetical protein